MGVAAFVSGLKHGADGWWWGFHFGTVRQKERLVKHKTSRYAAPMKRETDPRIERLADRIRTAREVRGLGVNAAAKRAGVPASTISRVENGIGTLSLASFLAICDALGLKPALR